MKKYIETKDFILCLIASFLLPILYKWYITGEPFQRSTVMIGIGIFIVLLIGLAIGTVFFEKIFNRPVKQQKIIILPAFILFLLVVLLIYIFFFTFVSYVDCLIAGGNPSALLDHMVQAEFTSTFFINYITWASVGFIFFFYTTWRQAVDREQKLKEENLQYKYINLKTQVNPHFLFNSLNTVSELIYEDPKKADKYIQKLAGIYRYILDHEETDLVSLNEEIVFVKQYFDLQQERAENKIQLDMDIKNVDKFRIIPISLQILIENALKHNSMSEECPLKIHIGNDDEYITVSNGIQRKDIIAHSSGTGLSNLKGRVKLITGKEIIIDQKNNIFTVKLPILESFK